MYAVLRSTLDNPRSKLSPKSARLHGERNHDSMLFVGRNPDDSLQHIGKMGMVHVAGLTPRWIMQANLQVGRSVAYGRRDVVNGTSHPKQCLFCITYNVLVWLFHCRGGLFSFGCFSCVAV
jgi:hypothetical protein